MESADRTIDFSVAPAERRPGSSLNSRYRRPPTFSRQGADSACMPKRATIIAISVAACVFGGLSIAGPEDQRGAYYAVNIVLSILAAVLASLDLRRRGYGWGWAMLAAYLLPLVGTILYIVFSGQRTCSPPVEGPAAGTG